MKLLLVLAAVCTVAFGRLVPRFGSRIVGGERINIEDAPYQVSVRQYDQHICGGSIIDQYNILTAAHCVYGMDHSRYSVSVGNTNHNSGEKIVVVRIIMNANYDPNIYDNDMAILKLAYPLRFTSTIQPIGLQPRGKPVQVGAYAWVSGWGVLYEGSKEIPESLRAVAVRLISDAECKQYYPGQITSNMLGALTTNKDSCQGDSGGPLNCDGYLCGVVSWGVGCARPNKPGVYAKVAIMYDWIIQTCQL